MIINKYIGKKKSLSEERIVNYKQVGLWKNCKHIYIPFLCNMKETVKVDISLSYTYHDCLRGNKEKRKKKKRKKEGSFRKCLF